MENVANFSGMHIINETAEKISMPRIEKKRRCRIVGCKTILNPYNLGEYCEVHKPLVAILKQNEFVKRTNAKKSGR